MPWIRSRCDALQRQLTKACSQHLVVAWLKEKKVSEGVTALVSRRAYRAIICLTDKRKWKRKNSRHCLLFVSRQCQLTYSHYRQTTDFRILSHMQIPSYHYYTCTANQIARRKEE